MNCWGNLYEAINRANVLLENLDRSNATAAVKDQIRGEALFLRAYYHFVLVGYWGDVPLKLQSTQAATDVNIARTPAAQVYAQVIKDMTTAEGLLKNGSEWGNSGRISKTAAAGRALPREYVRRRPPQRRQQVRRRPHLGPEGDELGPARAEPRLFADFQERKLADVYELREAMWEVEFNGTGVGSIYNEAGRFGSTLGVRNDIADKGFMQGTYVATGVQYALYGTGDLRRDWNIATYYYPSYDATKGPTAYASTYIWGRYINKWRRENETYRPYAKNLGPTNWPLLRYADVLLMFAEAENEVNGGPTAAGAGRHQPGAPPRLRPAPGHRRGHRRRARRPEQNRFLQPPQRRARPRAGFRRLAQARFAALGHFPAHHEGHDSDYQHAGPVQQQQRLGLQWPHLLAGALPEREPARRALPHPLQRAVAEQRHDPEPGLVARPSAGLGPPTQKARSPAGSGLLRWRRRGGRAAA